MNLTQSSYVTKKLAEEKVFKDPIHKYVHVKDQLIWDLIKTKEFQRLRRIKQLGTLYLAFHTAEHSRFGHSLGCLLYTSPSPRDLSTSRMPSSA